MDLTPIPRRVLLRRTVSSAILLWLGSLSVPPRASAKGRMPPEGLKTLTVDEFEVLTTVCKRILDDGSGDPPWAIARKVALRIDRELQYWEPHNRGQFRQLLALFEHGTFWLSFKFGPFTAMSAAEQDAYLADWMTSGLDLKRQGFQTFKTMVAFFHFTLDETWPRVGYDGPWVQSPPMPLD